MKAHTPMTAAYTLAATVRSVPQFTPPSVRRTTGVVRDLDKRRAAFALAVTFRLAGFSAKKAAHVLEVHESTVSRHMDGQHDSPASRFREMTRKLTQKGAPPIPLIADLMADIWDDTVRGKSLDELESMKRDLHRQEQREDAKVDVWQSDDLAGAEPESEEAVDEAILGQITRLVQLYAVRAEIRALEGK